MTISKLLYDQTKMFPIHRIMLMTKLWLWTILKRLKIHAIAFCWTIPQCARVLCSSPLLRASWSRRCRASCRRSRVTFCHSKKRADKHLEYIWITRLAYTLVSQPCMFVHCWRYIVSVHGYITLGQHRDEGISRMVPSHTFFSLNDVFFINMKWIL